MENHSAQARFSPWSRTVNITDGVASKGIRVFVMDLLSIVPYYTGHLCAKLQDLEGVELTVGAIRYEHDKPFFQRIGVRTDSRLLNLSAKLSSRGLIRRPLKALEYLWNLASLAVRFSFRKPDILHVQFLPLVTLGIPVEMWFLRFSKALGVKVVYTVHNVVPHERSRRDKHMYSRMYDRADRLICHDLPAKNRLIAEFHVPAEKISVVPHGPLFQTCMDSETTETRRFLGLPADGQMVLFQGIIRPYKGVLFLLKAWQRAIEGGFHGFLVIAGTGEADHLAEISRTVDELELNSSVRLVSRFVPIEELENYYKAADILVYPYSAVTTSGALMTGIGYGKPIIATALPAFYEILHHEDNSLLVGYGHIEGFAEALLRLGNDEDLRRRLAAQVRSTSTSLPTWSEIAKQTVKCYAAALARDDA